MRASQAVVALGIAVLLQIASSPAYSQGISAKQADQLLKQNQEVLKELKTIHELLDRQLAAPARAPAAPVAPDDKVRVRFSAGGFSMGRDDAPITLVEYTDYQCPFCRQFHLVTFEEIKKNYIDTGKVRYISRDFPLPMHENALRAALAARCAADQGKFWELRHVMIVNAAQLQPQNLNVFASDLKLDMDKFNTCMESNKYQAEIAADMEEGRNVGVSGTPSFVIGHVADGSLDGARVVGALPYGAFDAKLKESLAQPAGTPKTR